MLALYVLIRRENRLQRVRERCVGGRVDILEKWEMK